MERLMRPCWNHSSHPAMQVGEALSCTLPLQGLDFRYASLKGTLRAAHHHSGSNRAGVYTSTLSGM